MLKNRLKFILKCISNILESVKDFIIKMFSSRVTLVSLVFIVFFGVLFSRLFYLQIVKSDYYQDNFTQKAQKVIYTEGARGNIYDCNGKLLAHNEVSYSVVMTDEIPSSDTKGTVINKIVFDTINIIENNGDYIIQDFNIEFRRGKAEFKETPLTPQITFLCNVFGLKSSEIYEKGYDKYTAQEIIDYMCSDKRFDIDSEVYSLEERIKICSIRYALSLNSYQKYISTEIAKNVSIETQAAIMEAKSELIGVDIKETYKRVYDQGIYYGSILGYTGQVSEEELDYFNLNNELGIEYLAGDIVGKTGIEQSFDAYLKGIRGTETVFVDSKGAVLDVIDSTKSGSGNDLYLTLDTDLQIAYYEILEREIAGLLVARIVNYDYVNDGNDEIVYVPVKDVYFKLLTNVIEPLNFSNVNASDREKRIYEAFLSHSDYVLLRINEQLTTTEPYIGTELSVEFNEYMYYVYDFLGSQGILNKSLIDTSDETYIEFAAENISLKEFLMHAISQNWIDVSNIDASSKYATSDEIYAALVEKINNTLVDDKDFQELMYYFMVYNEEIDPYDICMLLYDQNKLEMDENGERLEYGEISSYTYVINQITDLVITPDMVALDPCSGSFVLTDTKTGKVKALISYPSYDNNKLSGSIDPTYWNELNNDESAPLYNRATQALTAPGSTFKPITSAAGLNEGVITTNTYIHDEGIFEYVTPSPKCWIYPGSHDDVNVIGALSVSCNYFYYTVGYYLSLDRKGEYSSLQGLNLLEEYATKMGLNQKSGIEIEENNPRFSSTDSVRTAIGQGTSGFATVQLARYVTCVANMGTNYQLSLVDKVIDKSGNVVLTVEPNVTGELELPDGSWDAIQLGMRSAVSVGSVSDVFEDSAITIAGKTGTAQESIVRSNHSNFIGYSPYYEPEIAFACSIRNGGSSTYAAETTRDCIEYYYGYKTIQDVLSTGATDIELHGVTD